MNKYRQLIAQALELAADRGELELLHARARQAQAQGASRSDSAYSALKTVREDALDSSFMALQLQQLEAEIYRQVYPDLKWRTIMPVKNSGLNPGAESFAWRKYDTFGVAKFFANMAMDLPLVGIKGEKFVSKVEALGDGYDISVDELLAAAMANLPLEQEKASFAAEAIERLMDNTAAKGDTALGFEGFVNQSTAVIDTAATVSGQTTWAQKLTLTNNGGPIAILKDLHDHLFAMDLATYGKIKPNRLLMSQFAMNILSTTQMSTAGSNNRTILQQFLESSPYIRSMEQIDTWFHLNNASSTSLTRIVSYCYDRRYIEAYVPKEIEVLPAQPHGFTWKVPMWAKFGGLVNRMPMSIRYLDGVE